MSQAEIERFVADLKSNADLRAEADKLRSGKSEATPYAALVVFAASKGYAFTAAEMAAWGKTLSDSELSGVVGGNPGRGHGFVSPTETNTFEFPPFPPQEGL